MKLASGLRTFEQLWSEVQEIAALLGRLQINDLIVSYGYNGNSDDRYDDELYQEIEIKTDDLLGFLSNSIAEGRYHLGEQDFHIQSLSGDVEFLLCHESDVHLETGNAEVASHMRARWAAQPPPGYEQIGQEWVPLREIATG